MKSELETRLKNQIINFGLPVPESEYKFHDFRKWRFDFAYPSKMVAIEVEGGVYNQGRHTRPKGFEGDCQKYNAAAMEGWVVLRFTGGMIKDGTAINTIKDCLNVTEGLED